MAAEESLSDLFVSLDTDVDVNYPVHLPRTYRIRGQEVFVGASALAFAAHFGNFDNCSFLSLNAVDFAGNSPGYALVEENLSGKQSSGTLKL